MPSPDMRELWFENDNTRLFAVEDGDGTPVILLHGGLANHLACWHFAAPLAARCRLITPDVRASGRSHFHGALTWDQLADDVAALVRHLGLARAVIGGTSFGAGIAVRVALRHPAITAALLVLNPAFGGADLGLSPAQDGAMQAMDAAGRRAPAEGIDVLFPLLDGLSSDMRERARPVFATYDPRSVAAFTHFMASGVQPFESAADLAAIAASALVIPGIDPMHPPEVADVFRRHLPNCTVRDAAPSEYAAAIAEFLDARPL